MRQLLFLLILASCTREDRSSYSAAMFQASRRPVVAISPMEDCTHSNLSSQTTAALTEAVVDRIKKKNRISVSKAKAQGQQFLVTMQLVQHEESALDASELTISVHLRILDVRSDKPKVILQEVLNQNTLLETPLRSTDVISWNNSAFRVSPMGLAHSKLAREIALRVEDYIKLAMRG